MGAINRPSLFIFSLTHTSELSSKSLGRVLDSIELLLALTLLLKGVMVAKPVLTIILGCLSCFAYFTVEEYSLGVLEGI